MVPTEPEIAARTLARAWERKLIRRLQAFDGLESVHQKDAEDQPPEQEDQPVGFDFGEHPGAEDDSGHHPERQHPGDRPIGVAKPLRQQMNLRDAGCERHQQDRVMRPQHPGGEEDDRHVGAESQGTSDIEPGEVDQEHEADQRRGVMPSNATISPIVINFGA